MSLAIKRSLANLAAAPLPKKQGETQRLLQKIALAVSSFFLLVSGASLYFTAGHYPIAFFISVGVGSVAGGVFIGCSIILIRDGIKRINFERRRKRCEGESHSPARARNQREYMMRLEKFTSSKRKVAPTFFLSNEIEELDAWRKHIEGDLHRNRHYIEGEKISLIPLDSGLPILAQEKYESYAPHLEDEIAHLLKAKSGFSRQKRKRFCRKLMKALSDPEGSYAKLINQCGNSLQEEIKNRIYAYREHSLYNAIYAYTGENLDQTNKIFSFLFQKYLADWVIDSSRNLNNFKLKLLFTDYNSNDFIAGGYNIKRVKGKIILERYQYDKLVKTTPEARVLGYYITIARRDIETERMEYEIFKLDKKPMRNIYIEQYAA